MEERKYFISRSKSATHANATPDDLQWQVSEGWLRILRVQIENYQVIHEVDSFGLNNFSLNLHCDILCKYMYVDTGHEWKCNMHCIPENDSI